MRLAVALVLASVLPSVALAAPISDVKLKQEVRKQVPRIRDYQTPPAPGFVRVLRKDLPTKLQPKFTHYNVAEAMAATTKRIGGRGVYMFEVMGIGGETRYITRHVFDANAKRLLTRTRTIEPPYQVSP